MNALNSIVQNNLGVSVVGAVVIGLLLLIWNIFLHSSISRVKRNQQELFSGKEAKNLEQIVLGHVKGIKELDRDIQDLYGISNQIHNLASRSVHKVGMIRFNPFKDLGGDQSFSVALLDGQDSGVVVSSLHTREGTRVYAKAIEKGKSVKHPLSDEEQEAIKKAKAGAAGVGQKA